ncbi:MAG: ribokinase [Clostridia bacterium]|nr:ribokinase [Clostridia bacterium]
MDKVDVIVLNSHGVGQVCHIKRLPRRGETLAAKNWKVEEDGGKGVTVSVALGRLGIATGYIGKVGCDPWGEMGQKWLTESGVDATYMIFDETVATGTGLIMIDEEGYNTIVDGDSACEFLTREEIHEAISAMKDAKVFITGFGMPFKKSLEGAKIAKEEFGLTTICNISPLPDEEMGILPYLDYMILNDVEAKALAGLEENADDSIESIAKKLRDNHQCKNVIITCGENGSFLLEGAEGLKIEGIKVNAVDTIGAGDGYLAAFVAGLVRNMSAKNAAEYAGKYAAYKVTRKGSMTKMQGMGYPCNAEVEAFIQSLR